MIFLVSCSGDNLKKKIVSTWKVEIMQRNMGNTMKNMVVNQEMEFDFNEDGVAKITTHSGEKIKGKWVMLPEGNAFNIIANNEVKKFVIDSIKGQLLFITSGDVRFKLKKKTKSVD